jgi:hypothetical protein
MNIESEIRHFSELSSIDQARFFARFIDELTLAAAISTVRVRKCPSTR